MTNYSCCAASASTFVLRLAEALPGVEEVRLLRPEPRMALFFTDYSIGWLGLADGCWKYLFEMDSNRSRLFDVCGDP